MTMEFVEDLKRQWMAMIDAIDDSLVIVDEEFNILRQNFAYAKHARGTHGRSIRELHGEKCYRIFAGRGTPCPECLCKNVLQTQQQASWISKAIIPERDIEIRAHPLQEGTEHAAPSPRRLVVHYRDITEQRLMQEGLAQADKLAAVGKLASGVAHEINSPLAGILAFAQMALKEMDEDDAHRPDLVEIETAARKCKAIVEQLLALARQENTSDVAEVDIVEVVKGTLRLASPILRKSDIELAMQIPEQKVLVTANAGKLGQVVLNLVTNALYAMKDSGGTLEVSCTVLGESVLICIKDTGIGIDPKHLHRIFDPFFTTKPVGEGTGLGLSISYSIIKQYGGDIRVVSSPGLGASFTVSLPLVAGNSLTHAKDVGHRD